MTVETENFAKLGDDLIFLLSLSKEEIEVQRSTDRRPF